MLAAAATQILPAPLDIAPDIAATLIGFEAAVLASSMLPKIILRPPQSNVTC
jgi:hypothetical protein